MRRLALATAVCMIFAPTVRLAAQATEPSMGSGGTGGAGGDATITVASGVDLPRLIDLCAERLGFTIQYDDSTLKSQPITVRVDEGLSAEDLWRLVNDILESQELTTIATDERILRVVRLADARQQARLRSTTDDAPQATEIMAGYSRRLFHLTHASVKTAKEAVSALLSDHEAAEVVSETEGLLLVAGRTPNVEQAAWLLEQLDRSGERVAIESYRPSFIDGATLHSHLTAAVTQRNTLAQRPLRGTVRPSPDGASLILVAPADSLDQWTELIEQFDTRPEVERRTYTSQGFSGSKLNTLVEQSARIDGPRGSGDQWNVVEDELTGTLLVTATGAEHARVDELMRRLAALPSEARRPLRTFRIRNRSIDGMVDLLTRMTESGMLNASITSMDSAESDTGLDERETDSEYEPPTTAPPASFAGDETSPLHIAADRQTSTLIAMGEPRLLNEVEALIEQLDVREPQVKIEVLLVALSESDTLDLGVELRKLEVRGSTLFNLSSLFGLGSPALAMSGSGGDPVAPPTGAGAGGTGFTGLALSPGDFSVVIRALENVNEGRVLSMPFVTVNNNFDATIDSVLEEPFLQTNASNTVATTSLGGTSQAGTQVTVKPQIAAGDHLILDYTVSLSTFVGESSDPSLPPPRQENSLSSQVTIPDGYTIAVGGIELVNEAEAQTKTPVLSDIPLLGWLFQSESTSSSRTRFYVFIRANVLRHNGFEDLKYLSEQDLFAAGLEDDAWPKVEPRLIR